MSLVDLGTRERPAHVSDEMLELAAAFRRYAADIESGKTAAAAVIAVDYNTDNPARPTICYRYGADDYAYVIGGAIGMLHHEVLADLVEQKNR